MRKRVFRLTFLTVPVTALLLWMAVNRYVDAKVDEHLEAANEIAHGLTLGACLYAQDHGGHLPPAEHWEDVVRPYLGAVPITLPSAPGMPGRRFAYNRAAAGLKLTDIPDTGSLILFYTSTANTPSPSDDFTSIIPANSSEPVLIGYAGGQTYTYPSRLQGDLIARSRRAVENMGQPQANAALSPSTEFSLASSGDKPSQGGIPPSLANKEMTITVNPLRIRAAFSLCSFVSFVSFVDSHSSWIFSYIDCLTATGFIRIMKLTY